MTTRDPVNAFTVDLEPSVAFYDNAPMAKQLVEKEFLSSTLRLLDILEDSNTKATFFVLGVVNEWFPSLVEEIRSRKHEIAFHSFSHEKLFRRSLQHDIARSRNFLTQYGVKGFRAPRMHITLEDILVLKSAGFLYDSSTYGPSAPTRIVRGFVEVPVSTYPSRDGCASFPKTFVNALMNFELPIGSGLCIALFSTELIDRLIVKINKRGLPFVSFIHPWQISGVQKLLIKEVVKKPLKIPYLLKINEEKLKFILRRHYFVTMLELIKSMEVYPR